MPKTISSRDQRIAKSGESTISTTYRTGRRQQTVSITDLISEGEIYGLVNGQSSIYLNNERVVDPDNSAISENSVDLKDTTVSLVNGSNVASFNKELGYLMTNASFRTIYVRDLFNSALSSFSISVSDTDLSSSVIDIVTASSFFTSSMEWGSGAWTGVDNVRLSIDDTAISLTGNITIQSPTQSKFHSSTTDGVGIRKFLELATGNTITCTIDGQLWLNNLTDSTGTSSAILLSPTEYPTGTYAFAVSAAIPFDPLNILGGTSLGGKFQNLTTQFRVGKAEGQTPMTNFGGVSASTYTANVNQELTYNDGLSESGGSGPALNPVTLSSDGYLNLTNAQATEVDEVRLTFAYNSLICQSEEDGKKYEAGAVYKIQAIIHRSSTVSNLITLVEKRIHVGKSTTPIVFEERINLEPFKPFSKFDIKVTRLSRGNGVGVDSSGVNKNPLDRIAAAASITTVTSVIKENLTYPSTAYANVTFSSKEFTSAPVRSYHVKGLKLLVPSNYITRDENDGISAVYQGLWDGTFRPTKVYTNNPAWIFYDIITNDRYGLGNWISPLEIDKFALYRIAKYCDELVSDGKGGQEPRFVSNIYLTKATDAYKVLKDITSSFLTLMYWLDGQISPVIDQAKDAVYTFSKANIINGAFSYESTGSKTRANQVIVSWNNPESNYSLEPIIVEDRDNIIETGRIITEDAVAFGCTSEAQAYRYGRWKLWTAVNQTRLINFATSINAAFLAPGDIIKIQDADEFNIAYSGRISKTGTLDTNTIPLDRSVVLTAGSTYFFSTIVEAPNVTNEGEAEQHDTIVETIQVSSTGTVSSLELVSPLSSVPETSAVWVLKEVTPEGVSTASAKDYKILSITENSKNEFSISGVIHFNEKFDAIEEDFTLVAPDTVYPKLLAEDFIPAPKNVYIEAAPDYNRAGDEYKLTWDIPINSDGTLYNELAGFQILHNIPGSTNIITVESNVNEWTFNNVPNGTYYVSVRTINTINNSSKYKGTNFTAYNSYALNVPRQAQGIGIGGTADSGLRLSAAYVLNFEVSPTAFYAIVNPFNTFRDTVTGLNTISTNLSDGLKHSVLFDISAKSLIAIRYNALPVHGVPYWYNAIDVNIGAAETPENTFVSKTGTVTVAVNSSEVVGSGTSFLTQYTDGQVIRFGADKAAIVSNITDDTHLTLDRSFSTAINASTHFASGLIIDFATDVIVAEFTKSGSTSIVKSLTGVDTTLTGPTGSRGAGRWQIGVTTLPTTSAQAQTAWNTGAGDQPTEYLVGDQAFFYTGTLEVQATQSVWVYTLIGWSIQTEIYDGGLIVNYSVTEDKITQEGNFGTLVASLGTFDVVDTGLLDADSVIAREIQVFPEGGTAPTISGTTLTGAGIDLKQDGDLYVGDFSADKYMFWDQSEGLMTFRGSLDASDINAGFISADRIETGSLSADIITAGTIQSVHIQAGSIQADDIGVANLSSINANIGAITAGTIRGNTMPDADTAPAGAETGAFLDLTGGKMVFGNADKFILWDGTDLTISGVTINAAQLTGSTGFATAGYVDTQISALVDSAPGTLDTLNELAAAIGDNQNFATDVAASIGDKLPKAGGEMTGNITFSSTQTVDGRDVSVDGTKLDTIASGATNTAAPYYTSAISVGDGGLTQNNFTTTLKNKLDGVATNATNTAAPYYTAAISVGDGGLTEKNFTTALNTKLAGIATGATNTAAPYYTAAIPNATSSVTGLMTSTFATKLDGIASGATNVTNNNQLTNGAGYITNADANVATFGGSLPSAYIKTDSAQALGNLTNALTNNGSIITLTRGDGTTDVVTVPNTTYSVGDGGLTQKNFTTTLKDKLDGVATGATNTAAPYYTAAISVGDGGLTQKNFTTALDTKLAGIATGATNTAAPYYTAAISVGDGGLTEKNFTTALNTKLTGIPSNANYYEFPFTIDTAASANTVVRREANGYIFAVYANLSGSVQLTAGASGTAPLVMTGGNGTDNYLRSYNPAAVRAFLGVDENANDYSHPQEGVDFGAALTGANVISDIAVNGNGHVTGFTSRALTLGNLGYTASVAATDNSLVQRHASGYIYANYFNTTPNTVTSGITQVCVETSNDGFIRHGTAAAVRSFLNVADGANAGVTSISSTSTGLTVTGGTTTTPSLALHANLQNLSAAGAIDGTLRVGILRADTVVADYIESDEIKSVHLEISKDTGADRIHMDGANNCIKVYANNVLRVKIGNLA